MTQENISFGLSEYAGLIGAILLADHLCSIGEWAGISFYSTNSKSYFTNLISFIVFYSSVPIEKQTSYTSYSPPQSYPKILILSSIFVF